MCPNNSHITTDEIRNIFLDLHNEHRSDLARGLVQNGNTQTMLRPASKMLRMKYNCGAEASAFAWAQKCLDQDSNTTGVSENRYTFPNRNLEMTVVARRMAWDTTEYFGCAAYKCPNFINAVCHYYGRVLL
ncbi:SCP-like protein [Ancylostoma caninum]|uniref:SCP-like protein n=1 Tax=Ancylostoma caninum TaxID=29170 RepID=A0A368GHW5_ANCCA|nr:SCP-like protein [Ancylostoma caninum]